MLAFARPMSTRAYRTGLATGGGDVAREAAAVPRWQALVPESVQVFPGSGTNFQS
jgi:hypothetical protein